MTRGNDALCPICGRPQSTGLCTFCGSVHTSVDDPVCGPRATTQAGPALASIAATIGPIAPVQLPDTKAGTTESAIMNPSSLEMPATAHRPPRVMLFGEIARGGMGAVLKGRDPDLGRDLAVKVLLEAHKENPDLVRRFVEEAQIGGQLQHPGIVPIYELGSFGDRRPYFTMKLVKGQTLADLLGNRDSTTDDLARFLAIFEQVCQTMAYAHSRNVIHRDLKPSNVMVGSFGEVQVMDWGLAKVLPKGGVIEDAAAGRTDVQRTIVATARVVSDSDWSMAGSVLGTPAYMAPEQARGEVSAIDERADVFALGSILCEILTGQPAFVGRSGGEIHRKAALGDLGAATAALEGIDADLELVELAKDCLAREPEDRPRHAGTVAEQLTAYRSSVQERLRAAEIAQATQEARAEEEAKRRVLADELAREAEARAEESRRSALVAHEKAIAERRARRLTGALAAAILGLIAAVGGGYAWVERQRSEREARIDLALREAEVLRGEALRAGDDGARWSKAVDAARSVERLLADARDEPTRKRVATLVEAVTTEAHAAENDRKLLESLIDIRSSYADNRDGPPLDAAYGAAFREADIDLAKMSPDDAGNWIKSRPATVASAIAAALDNWAAVRREKMRDRAGAQRLTRASRVADPDPWRTRLRDALDLPEKRARLEALRALARTFAIDPLAPASLALLGSALIDAGDPLAAENVLRPAQRRHPGDAELNYCLALCLEELARRDEAIRFYTAARSIRPEMGHDLAHALELKGEWPEAIALFEDLTRLRPTNGRHFMCLGQALQRRGRARESGLALEAAIASLTKKIRERPDDNWAHANLGNALKSVGKLDEAIAEYRESIRLRPDEPRHYTSLAGILVDQGKVDEAIALIREAMRLKPDHTAHSTMAHALTRQGKLDDAIAEYRTAVGLQPDSHISHESLADLLRRQRKWAEALEEFRIASRIDPSCAYVRTGIVDALVGQGRLDLALAACQDTIRIHPDDKGAHKGMRKVLRALGRIDEAIADCREILRLNPADAECHNDLAWETLTLPARPQSDYDEALARARKAVELAPNEAYLVNTLALAEYRARHWAESIAAAQKSMAMSGGVDGSDRFFQAMAHWRMGAQSEARKWFDKAVAWTKEHDPQNPELLEFWTEASQLLGQPGPATAGAGTTDARRAKTTK
jgi:eukaryotic-like serine/threonine-protein kinase